MAKDLTAANSVAGCQGRNSQLAGYRGVRLLGLKPVLLRRSHKATGWRQPGVRNVYTNFGQAIQAFDDHNRPAAGQTDGN